MQEHEDGSLSEPPADATEDELYLLRRWGARILPADPEAFFEVTSYEWEPRVQAILEPLSEKVRCFDLFEEASSPYVDFVNTRSVNTLVFQNQALIDVEGPKKLADRFGPLLDGPQFIDNWTHSIQMLQNAVTAWKKADRTGDFKQLIRGFSQKGKKLFGRNRIDASISLREDPLSGAPRLCIRTETLLDALWTQLAQAVDGSQSLRNCVVCKQWFTLRAGHGRSDKEYCSNACRMRAYRKRKAKE